jgi:hypothetical protein
MTEPTDDLRQVVARAIAERLAFNSTDDVEAAADAAIAAYETHRPRVAAPEGCQCGYDDQCAFAARAEKAEAERDAAWCAGRDAAVSTLNDWLQFREDYLRNARPLKLQSDSETEGRKRLAYSHQANVIREIAKVICALTPPEDKP